MIRPKDSFHLDQVADMYVPMKEINEAEASNHLIPFHVQALSF